MTNAMPRVTKSTPAPRVTREQVAHRSCSLRHQRKAISAAQDEGDHVLDLLLVLRLEDLVALLLVVDLDRRPCGQVRVELRLRVGLALALLGDRLVRGPVFLGAHRMALEAAALLQ